MYGLIRAFVIKERTNPSVKMIGKGKFEVGKVVTLSPVEGCVSNNKLWRSHD
jgi:hypothetical protein